MPLNLRVLSKWVRLFFVIFESLGFIAALLKVALKIAYPHEVFGPAVWAEPMLELTLRIAIVGLILSAYLRLRTTSRTRGPYVHYLQLERFLLAYCYVGEFFMG